MGKDKLEGVMDWAVWALLTGFLLWVLTAAIKGCVMLVTGSLAWPFAILVVPATLLDIWLLDGCLNLAVKSSGREER